MWRTVAVALGVLLSGMGCSEIIQTEPKSVVVTLRFSGPRYVGGFYKDYLPATDYAVWVEDGEGEYIKTLGISQSVVSVGKYPHVDHLPTWKAKSGVTYEQLQAETQEGIAPSFDAVSRASVLFREDMVDTTLTFEWDLKDARDQAVPEGTYYFCAEVANIAKDRAVSYEVIHEATRGKLDLKARTASPAEPTEHILELKAEYRY